MKFIKLTLPNEKEVFVNLELVRDIYFSGEKTSISFDNEYVLNVKERPDEIFEKAELHVFNH